MTPAQQAAILRRVIKGEHKSFVLFSHGTCVVFEKAPQDMEKAAVNVIAEYGPVKAGTVSGDFRVIQLPEKLGWVVGGHHPDVLTLVVPSEVPKGAPEFKIGMVGRSKREDDARDQKVVHVDKGKAKPS